MIRKFALGAAILLSLAVAAPPASAGHNRGHWGPVGRTVYVENHISNDFQNMNLTADWRWGGQSIYGPVYTVVDLWALGPANASSNYCDPVYGRIVVCVDNRSTNGYAYAAAPGPDAQGHAQWCVVGLRSEALYDQAAWEHEIGHCLGLAHGGTGIMNGLGRIDQHDLDAVYYAHKFGPHSHP